MAKKKRSLTVLVGFTPREDANESEFANHVRIWRSDQVGVDPFPNNTGFIILESSVPDRVKTQVRMHKPVGAMVLTVKTWRGVENTLPNDVTPEIVSKVMTALDATVSPLHLSGRVLAIIPGRATRAYPLSRW